MSLFKTKRPLQVKEKAIRLMKQEEIVTIGINIPLELKRKFKTRTSSNGVEMTGVLLTFIEKYLKEEEQKEDK